MNVYDCFMYFDEDLLLHLRLNILNKYVDKFVITESKYLHSGKEKKLNFDVRNFSKFKDKIIYIPLEKLPEGIEEVKRDDNIEIKNKKILDNSLKRENNQRNQLIKGLVKAEDNDLILLSDLDEIPSLKTIDLKKIKTKIIIFDQIMCYYKFNLAIPNYKWFGTRACLKKDLKSPQWLRNIKARKYSFYRLDILFNENLPLQNVLFDIL